MEIENDLHGMELYITTKDFLVSGEEFHLQQDRDKELLITSPQPHNLSPYYKSEDYISHTDNNRGFIASIYQRIKKYSTSKKVRLFDKYAGQNKTILDIGAGTGDLLIRAKQKGYEVAGVDPNSFARKKAFNKGIEIKEELNFNRKFQLISLWHVIEHLPNPSAEVKRIKECLEEQGTLFVAAPNYKSYDAIYYKEYWAAYDVPRHLWHFSKNSMRQLFEKHNMEIIDIKPMIFDAFYISILSEKYKTGKSNFVKAILIGMVSNLKASLNGEYSSLLYVIKNKK